MPRNGAERGLATVTWTNPKSLAIHMSDRAHMRDRVPRLACQFAKPRDDRGYLLHLAAVDSDHAQFWGVLGSPSLGLFRLLRTGPQSGLLQMSPTEPVTSFRRIPRGDREGPGQCLRHRSLQAFASRAASWHQRGCCHKLDHCPRMSLSSFCGSRNWHERWVRPACWCGPC